MRDVGSDGGTFRVEVPTLVEPGYAWLAFRVVSPDTMVLLGGGRTGGVGAVVLYEVTGGSFNPVATDNNAANPASFRITAAPGSGQLYCYLNDALLFGGPQAVAQGVGATDHGVLVTNIGTATQHRFDNWSWVP